jgi:transcriptional regulator with XRE-family HTH domain
MILPEDKKTLEDMGKRLRELREEQQISLRTLSGRARIDNSKISKIEKGQINITFLILLRLCAGLEVKPKMVFEKTEN